MLPLPFSSPVPAEDISGLYRKNIKVVVLRLDAIHPKISGNKWFKLHHYIGEAIAQGKKNIITFGGAWSNHILATAAACKLYGLNAHGIIRGEEPVTYSSTLKEARKMGMQFAFISREAYREKSVPEEWLAPDNYLIQEGGYGEPGAQGAAEILDHYKEEFSHCCCAVGTGTTLAGLVNASTKDKQIIGISVMKNNRQLEKMIAALVSNDTEWHLNHEYHFGGYAKYQPALLEFMNGFFRKTGIPTDFVYTGKLFFAIHDLIEKDFFPADSKILIIHSGGLQGNVSLRKGTLMF